MEARHEREESEGKSEVNIIQSVPKVSYGPPVEAPVRPGAKGGAPQRRLPSSHSTDGFAGIRLPLGPEH